MFYGMNSSLYRIYSRAALEHIKIKHDLKYAAGLRGLCDEIAGSRGAIIHFVDERE